MKTYKVKEKKNFNKFAYIYGNITVNFRKFFIGNFFKSQPYRQL